MNSRQEQDFNQMKDPATWPGQKLCLKRYFPDRQIEFADLLSGADGTFNFVPLEGRGRRHGDIALLENLIKDGWTVD